MSISNFSKSNLSVPRIFEQKFGDRVKFDEALAPYVAYRVGGPADILVFPGNEDDLRWISKISTQLNLPITVIGTGTNLLVRDEGIRGVTVSLLHSFREIETADRQGDRSLVRCGGGVQKSELLSWATQHGLGGLEFSAGVPGTIGGGIYMNAGTKYGCYGDILRELRTFDFVHGSQRFTRDEMRFGYREQSVVKRGIVVWALFELHKEEPAKLQQTVERIIAERSAKQPLDYPSCGSTFKNPQGHSAGRLIEQTGLKGFSVGGAEISEKHANFILNKGSATAKDILTLIHLIKDRVKTAFDVDLECEVVVLGGNEMSSNSSAPTVS